MSTGSRRLLVFLLVFVPVIAIGYLFRKPVTNWLSNLGGTDANPIVVTQQNTPSPTAQPTASSNPGTASIAQISPSPSSGSGATLPKAGPENTFIVLSVIGLGVAGLFWRSQSRQTRAALRRSVRSPYIQ